MSISNWLESPGQFRKLLTALVSDKWERLQDSLSMDEPLLRQFASTQWAQRRLPDEPNVLAVVTLLIAYHFRCLLVDSIRSDNPTRNGIQDEMNVTLLMPLYIWPSYRIWILQEFPLKSRVIQVEAIHWLMDTKQRESGFMELGIEEPDGRLLTYLELKKNTTNLSRWIKDGFDRLYHAIYLAVVQTPAAQQKRPAVDDWISVPDPDGERDNHLYPRDDGISRPDEISIVGRSNGASKDEIHFLDSLIFRPYLNWKEASGTFLDLQRNGLAAPSLIQVARAIIDRHMRASNLDVGQRALAMELLSELPDWIGSENTSDPSISLKSIEIRWRQFHSSDPSPLIKALLESELLQIAGQDGRVRFTYHLIYDFFLSMTSVKRLHSTNPTPPVGQILSTWLYWMATQWLECGDKRNAGLILWYAGGSLPGYASGIWRQLEDILECFPQMALTDNRLWLLAAICWEAIRRNRCIESNHWKFICEIDIPPRTSHIQSDDLQEDMDVIFQDYRKGVEQYLNSSKEDSDFTLEIALGYDRASRNNPWCRKHAFSALRGISPTKEIEIRWMPFVYQQNTLREVILNYAKKEANWDLRLAAVELLAAWGVQEAKAFLTENEIKDLPAEYYHRARILRCALEGITGYREWV